MQIHKFGGASISSIDRIKKIPELIGAAGEVKKVVVISALGKTTNALEEIANLYLDGKTEQALISFGKLGSQHLEIAKVIMDGALCEACISSLGKYMNDARHALENCKTQDYNFFYDQFVSFGEMFSSILISYFLKYKGIHNCWLDARMVIKTNNNFREAGVLWDVTSAKVDELISPVFAKNNTISTQGFIGSTLQNETVTLGREGSDFTAGIFGNLLHAESVTIWKDVEGVMNADPRLMKNDAIVIPHLNYKEVIEMSYYGAQVIHPKTIKPLQNKAIPMYVRSFLNTAAPGTLIDGGRQEKLPPIIVYKFNQVLFSFQTKDYSFMEGKPTQDLYEIFAKALIKANLSQNTAINLLACIDDIREKSAFVLANSTNFDVTSKSDLTLLTIRHYNSRIVSKLIDNKEIILEQKTPDTVQIVFKS